MSTVDFIIDFEAGNVTPRECVEGFAELIKTGTCWELQGSYGRTAKNLIAGGLVSPAGVVDWDLFDRLANRRG